MSEVEYIGDEISAVGYRLCGVAVQIADRHNAAALIRQACSRASLVLIGSTTAKYLVHSEFSILLASDDPAVLIVPDVIGRQPVPNIATQIHRQLGMLE